MLAFRQQQTALLMNLYSAYLRCLLLMDVSSLLAKMAWSAQQAVHPSQRLDICSSCQRKELSCEGDLQLWALSDGSLLESMPFADPVTSVAVMQDEPYVLLGCASGNVQVVSLLDSSGSLAMGAAQLNTLELQPFQVDAEEMKGQGAVRCLMTRSHAGRHRMLVLHEETGVIIWDLRYECPVVLARNETAEALAGLSHARATCACWIGSKGICFAVGYSTSDVCVWGVPPPVQQGLPMDQPLEAVLLGKLRVTPKGEAVEQLTYIPGSATGCPNNLLVLGGQMLEMPPALTILPLDCLSGCGGQQGHTHGDFQPHSIPWFGAVQGWALVPPEASINEYDDPAAIVVLTEGGQLMVHDLNTFQPVPLSLPFQELQAVTDACMCASPVQLGPAGHIVMSTKLHCVTLQRLRALKGQSLGIASAAGTASKWRWVFSGGGRPQPASPSPGNSDLYFTGHEDGRVRVWDVTGNVPGLLATIPFDSGGPGVRLRAVTCLQVDVLAGLLVVGHKQGEARVYQFSQEQQEVSCVDLDGKRPAEHHSRQQPPGFQCILQCMHHAASISSIAIAARLKLVALADETGVLSLLELTRPSISFEQQVASQALVSLQFGQQVIPAATDRRPSDRRSPQGKSALADELLQTRPALFLCQSDGTLAILGVEGATLAGKPVWVQPKNRSQAVNMVLLGADGAPLYPKDNPLHLTWPHNNMISSLFQDDVPGVSPRAENLGAAGFGAAGLGAEGEPPTSPASQHSAWETEQRSNVTVDMPDDSFSNKSATGPSSIGEQSESEDDDYLAAAVAAVEAKQGKGGKKVKHPHLRALRSKLGSISRSKDKEGSGSIHAASPTSEQGLSSRQEVGLGQKTPSSLPDLQRAVLSHPDPLPLPPSAPGPESGSQKLQPPTPHGGPLAPAPPPEGKPPPQAQPAPQRQYVAEPDTDDDEEEEQAAAAHVLLCCDDSLRLYPAEGIRVGDRSSVKKVGLHAPIGFAAAFNGQHGPGLLDIQRSGDVGVWTLPGLEPVKVFSLSSCLGFPWSWQGEPSLLANLHRMCALAPDGHMALVGPCNEVVTLGILRGLQPPVPLKGLYDRDLSEASLAAAQAIADLQEKHEPWTGIVPNDAAITSPAEASGNDSPRGSGRTQAAGRAAHLGAFLVHVKDAASKVVEEGGAGMAKTLALGKRLPFGGGAASHIARPPPPTLQQLFSTTAPRTESSGEIANITDDEDENADKPDPYFQNRPAGSPAKQNWEQRQQDHFQRSPQSAFSSLQGAVGSMFQGNSTQGSSNSGQPDNSSGREELLYGAKQPESKGKGGVRSASEIRSAYGRSSTRERDIRSTMADNMVALEDRGEKLRNLQDKTAELGDGAADFASVAKALKEQSASRKWWQL
ncbi:hypothetical protein WJX77_008242 [Trebouxia sp. C0004]